MGKIAAQRQGNTQLPTWRRNVFRQQLLVVWTRCTDHDERSEEGNEHFILAQKNVAWLRNLKKELGTQFHGRRFRVWRWEQAVVQCLL